jgi:hypothetical protein
LLSRAGIANDIAEMCLGHVLPSIRATYDKFDYAEPKRLAYEALAGLLNHIINPPGESVAIPLRRERQRA